MTLLRKLAALTAQAKSDGMKKILLVILIVMSTTIASSAISFSQFVDRCSVIANTDIIKLTSDTVEQLRAAQVDTVAIINVKEAKDSIITKIKQETSFISVSNDMIVVKDNEDGAYTRIYVNPDSNKAEVLIVDIEECEINIVKVSGNIDEITKGISIRGKNLEENLLR